MSWFSNVWSKTKQLASAATESIGEAIADMTVSTAGVVAEIAEGAVEAVTDIVSLAKAAFTKLAKPPPESKKYTASDSRATESVDNHIQKFLEGRLPEAETMEEKLLAASQTSFVSHVKSIRRYIDKHGIDLDISEIDAASSGIEQMFEGSVTRYIRSQFSLSNNECKEAYSIEEPRRRDEAVHKHWDSVLDGSINALSKAVEQFFSEQNRLIQDSVLSRVKEQRGHATRGKAQLDNVLKLKTADRVEQERGKLRVQFVVDCCEAAMSEFANR